MELEDLMLKLHLRQRLVKLLIEKKNQQKKSFGVFNILVKSLTERPRPSPNIINAKQIGAIFVTISIINILFF